MDPEQIVVEWAKHHPEIVTVMLGGSRAKGTQLHNSDYDFSLGVLHEPSIQSAESLMHDFNMRAVDNTHIASRSNRHFTIVMKHFKTEDDIDLTLAFVNLKEFQNELATEGNYALVDEQFEFLKTGKVLHDPHGILAKLRELEYPGWVRKHAMWDADALAKWNLDKYKKAVEKRSLVTAELMKGECIWQMLKALAACNHVPIGSRHEYEALKATLTAKNAYLPPDFFKRLEECALKQNSAELESLVTETTNLIHRITN